MNGDYTGLQLAKIASNDLTGIETWNIGLNLMDAEGTRIDSGNAAGVLETGTDLHNLFSGRDMVAPKEDYIRLALRNPESAGNESDLLAYDYRAPGLDRYEWTIELSSTISSIDTKLYLFNFKSVPEWYSITLTDTQTGNVYPLSADASFDVPLTTGAPKTFILTANRLNKVTGVAEAPVALQLKNIFPNPFNPETTISYDVKQSGKVTLAVYNISGQLVETLVDGSMSAGSHQVVWNARKHSSGVYIVRLTSGGFTDTHKVTFMK